MLQPTAPHVIIKNYSKTMTKQYMVKTYIYSSDTFPRDKSRGNFLLIHNKLPSRLVGMGQKRTLHSKTLVTICITSFNDLKSL